MSKEIIERIKKYEPEEVRYDALALIAGWSLMAANIKPNEIIASKDPRLNWDELQETVCQIIETFEEFLNSRGITIDNLEKNDSTGNPKSNIYGTDYGELQSNLEFIFVDRGLVTQEIIDKFK